MVGVELVLDDCQRINSQPVLLDFFYELGPEDLNESCVQWAQTQPVNNLLMTALLCN